MPCNCTNYSTADNRLVQHLQSSVCPCRMSLHGLVQFAIVMGIRLVGHMLSSKTALPLWGSSTPCNTPFATAMMYNPLSMGKKTPKIAPSPWDLVTLLGEDQSTVEIKRVVMEISWRRQRDTQTY